MRQKDGWHRFPSILFVSACHLVVSASFNRFGETVGSHGENLQAKEETFRKLKIATIVTSQIELRLVFAYTESDSRAVEQFDIS